MSALPESLFYARERIGTRSGAFYAEKAHKSAPKTTARRERAAFMIGQSACNIIARTILTDKSSDRIRVHRKLHKREKERERADFRIRVA